MNTPTKSHSDLVTVVITTNNRGSMLKEAMLSVKHQTYRPIEMIVVDDSPLHTAKDIVNAFIDDSDFPVTYLESGNKGSNFSRNLGIDAATGAYIAFLDDDDLFHPPKIEKQLEYLKSQNCNLLSCYYDKIYPKDLIVQYRPPKFVTFLPMVFAKVYSFIPTSTLVVETSLAKRVKFDISIKSGQDWDFVLGVIRAKGKIGFLRECHVDKREHGTEQISNHAKDQDLLEIASKHKELLNGPVPVFFCFIRALKTRDFTFFRAWLKIVFAE
jgi:glycosyltransferase involved in cell wall biosynthesis